MTTRWKPKMGEDYWHVFIGLAYGSTCPVMWYDDDIDKNAHAFGNCFKTREQAEAALEKIKQVLLEAHNEATN